MENLLNEIVKLASENILPGLSLVLFGWLLMMLRKARTAIMEAVADFEKKAAKSPTPYDDIAAKLAKNLSKSVFGRLDLDDKK